MTRTLAIVGASLAGAKAAEAARAGGFDGTVVLIGDESRQPYERPPLSKDLLRGASEPDAARVHDDEFYDAHDIDVVNDVVVEINTDARTLRLASADTVRYDSLVIATGSRPRRLAIPGADLDGVHYLRTLDDALALRRAISANESIAVIGAGWIGSEVAASARQLGADVSLIDPAPTPLHGLLGDELGAVFDTLHAENGVDLHLGCGVTALAGTSAVEAVELSDGRRLDVDTVVVGVGAVPNVELAEAAGLAVDNGITVDEHLQTAVPGVYAAGDVASARHPHYRRHLRVEHWANALNQGLTAGGNAVGGTDVYDRLPYFFSDQYDLGLEYVGHHERGDEVVVRGDLVHREFIAFWHRQGVVTAAMNVNVWDVVEDLKSLITSGMSIDPARLRDPGTELSRLLG